MADVERVLAGVIAGVCLVMLGRLLLGERRRARLDRILQDWAWRVQRWAKGLWRWRAHRRASTAAAQVAKQAIERARHRVDKQGNVYTPEAFKDREPRRPD
jgi:hypothetical protein